MSSMGQSQGRELIAFVHGLCLRDVPPDVVGRAKTCLLDALGCGLFGSGQAWSRILADEMVAEHSAGHSTVIGRSELLSAPAAALCNGTAIHGFELDDLIAELITHPAACVIPAAMAAAESVDASGAALLEAIIAGYEVMHRVGLALGVEPAKRGFHTTSLVAPIACAVAAGKIIGLVRRPVEFGRRARLFGVVGHQELCRGSRRRNGQTAASRAVCGSRRAHGAACRPRISRPALRLDSRFGLLEVFGGAGAKPEKLTAISDRLGPCSTCGSRSIRSADGSSR